MKENVSERRTLVCSNLAIREQEGENSQSRTITGTAIVFNAESEVLDDWGQKFREVILPEAATMEFLNTMDIKMNLMHNRQLTVARCNKGKGSMRLSVDDKGVNFEFEAPNCDLGNQCLEMVRRGDYSGCSFEFYPKDYEIEKRNVNGQEEVKITHKRFAKITALTIGIDPAYTQTTVNARELLQTEPKPAKQEDEAAQAKQRELEADRRRRELQRMQMTADLY